MIYSRFNPPVIDVKPHCPTMRNIYAYDSLKCDTVVVGSQNIKEFISAPAPTCDIYYKINQFVSGDLNALGSGSAQGIYTDVSGMPSDINTIHKMINDVNLKIRQFGVSDIPSFLDLLHNAASSDPDNSIVNNAQKESEADSNA